MYKLINLEMGARIREIRKQTGLTSEKLAEAIGISNQFLCDVERGKKSLSNTNFAKMCKLLNVSADYIFFGTKENESRKRIHDFVDSIGEAYLPMVEQSIANTIQIVLMTREQMNQEKANAIPSNQEHSKDDSQ